MTGCLSFDKAYVSPYTTDCYQLLKALEPFQHKSKQENTMTESNDSGEPFQVFTSADRIRQLNEIDKVYVTLELLILPTLI